MIIDCIQLNTVKHSYTEHIYERWYKILIIGSLSENSFVDWLVYQDNKLCCSKNLQTQNCSKLWAMYNQNQIQKYDNRLT